MVPSVGSVFTAPLARATTRTPAVPLPRVHPTVAEEEVMLEEVKLVAWLEGATGIVAVMVKLPAVSVLVYFKTRI